MTRRITLVTAVIGLALVLAVPAAFGQGQPVNEDSWNYDSSGQKVANTSPGLGPDELASLYSAEQADVLTSPIVSPDAVDRAVAARQARQAATSSSYPDVVDRAVAARDTAGRSLRFDNYKVEPPTTVVVTGRTTDSGRELDWPQLGIGFAIGLLLALGLGIAMRTMHIRPLAH